LIVADPLVFRLAALAINGNKAMGMLRIDGESSISD